MIDLKEIFVAWARARNPTVEQLAVAESRLAICDDCSYKEFSKLFREYQCGACGCPLEKKVFSPKEKTACPLKKWEV